MSNDAGGSLSPVRVLKVVTPLVVLMVGGALIASSMLPKRAQQDLQSDVYRRLLGPTPTAVEGLVFADADGDLLADPPADDKCIAPDTLRFAYIPGDSAEGEPDVWKPLTDWLSQQTGKPVEYVNFRTVDEQLAALRKGELHVTAFNTGAVPTAVATAGFVPVCTYGAEETAPGYTMRWIVPAGSKLQKLADLKSAGNGQPGKLPKITFVDPKSNSGFMAAFVQLSGELACLPERDYTYSFSMGHDTSIAAVIAGETDLAPVASDLLERDIAAGVVDATKFRVLAESERFPPAALGYVVNLAPALRTAIADGLTKFDLAGSPLASKLGTGTTSRLVPVTYKDDWANVRRIDQAIADARKAAK